MNRDMKPAVISQFIFISFLFSVISLHHLLLSLISINQAFSVCVLGTLVLVTQSCLTLWSPTDCSLPGSSVHGIIQARILQWGAIPLSRRSNLGLLHCGQILCHLSHQGNPKKANWYMWVCSVISDSLRPMDYSFPGWSVLGISQARIREWVAITSSRRSSQARDRTWASCVSNIGRWFPYQHTTWEAPVTWGPDHSLSRELCCMLQAVW